MSGGLSPDLLPGLVAVMASRRPVWEYWELFKKVSELRFLHDPCSGIPCAPADLRLHLDNISQLTRPCSSLLAKQTFKENGRCVSVV